MSWVLGITFVVLLLLRIPVAFCMILSSIAALRYAGEPFSIVVGTEVSRALLSIYAFLAVPFFILAGDLMNQGGISRRITGFANAIVGPLPGGLAMVTTISAQMFGAVSGASSATCAVIGKLAIPAMEQQGYPRAFGAALAAC